MKENNQPCILLIDPPHYRLFKNTYGLARYPLSLGYLSGAIKAKTDWRVIAYNADFFPKSKPVKVRYLSGQGFENYRSALKNPSEPIWKEIAAVITRYQPAVVGISCKSQTFASARAVARIVKEIDPRIITIAGGPHPSMVGGEILAYPEFDVAVRGEGEAAIIQLLNAIQTEKSFEGIPGVIFRNNNQIRDNGPGAFIEDLNSLPFPHQFAPQVLHDYKLYPPSAFNHIFATRGCSYNCFFCGSRNVWGRKVRFRFPENVVREIQGLMQKGLTSVYFDDDTFGINTQSIRELCQAIKTGCPGLEQFKNYCTFVR
ncbi:MAG: cobalamin-dependent protein [Phycisphaerae bacterium]